VGFVTDINQLRGAVDADGWAGVQLAARSTPCLQAELIRSTDPARYQADAGRRGGPAR